jgi:myo-inositol 2-dehydrogenase / D-chiro-inositol 1-dehydrogenase
MAKTKKSDGKHNIGIIGLGINGLMHLNGFNLLDNCRIAAICDTDSAARSHAMEILKDDSVVQTNDYKKVCGMKEIDAIAVCTPTYLHVPIALAAIKNGKDVMLEKPIAPTIDKVDSVIARAFDAGRVVQVGLVYRYCNLYRTLAGMVERGDFGNVMMAWCKEFRDNFPTQWFYETEKSGGAILDKDCHHFDLFNWFIRSKPVRIHAMGGRHVTKGKLVKINCSYAPDKNYMIKNPDIVDHAFVSIEYENRAVANLSLCMYEVEPSNGLEVGIIGDNGAHAVATKDVVLNVGGGPMGDISETPVDYYYDNVGIGHIGAHIQHVEFVQCMESRRLPYANLLRARESMVVSMAAERSIKEKREVFYDEYDSKIVSKLLTKYKKEMSTPTPAPLPPPRPKKEKKTTREKEIFDAFVNLIRLLTGKRPIGEAAPFGPDVFKKALERLNTDQKYLKMAESLNAAVTFKYPNAAPVSVEIKNGKMEIIQGAVPSEDAVVTFTGRGWENLQSGDSLTKLFLSGQIKVEGNINKLQPHLNAFMEVGKALSTE